VGFIDDMVTALDAVEKLRVWPATPRPASVLCRHMAGAILMILRQVMGLKVSGIRCGSEACTFASSKSLKREKAPKRNKLKLT